VRIASLTRWVQSPLALRTTPRADSQQRKSVHFDLRDTLVELLSYALHHVGRKWWWDFRMDLIGERLTCTPPGTLTLTYLSCFRLTPSNMELFSHHKNAGS